MQLERFYRMFSPTPRHTRSGVNGSERNRAPVASKIALSSHCKLRNPPPFRAVERQHNILPGRASTDELLGHAFVCAVPLNPNFAVFEPGMHDDRIDPPSPLPAEINQQLVIVEFVKDRQIFDLSVTRRKFGVF